MRHLALEHIIVQANNGPADCYQQPTSPNHQGRYDSNGSFQAPYRNPVFPANLRLAGVAFWRSPATASKCECSVAISKSRMASAQSGAESDSLVLGMDLKRLVIIGSDGFISHSPLLQWLADQDASFTMLSKEYGKGAGATTGPVRPSEAKLRRAQALSHSSGAALHISRELINRKLSAQEDVARDKLLDASTADAITRFRAELPSADNINTIRLVESQAARAYWHAWGPLSINFPKNQLPRVPGHWMNFGARRVSPLTGSGPDSPAIPRTQF